MRASDCSGGRAGGICIQVQQRHASAFVRKAARSCPTDATLRSGARDNGNFVLE
jgi:hypothetical protein